MEKQRSSSSGFGSGEGLRPAESPCGLGLGDALQLPDKDLAGAVRVLEAPEESAVRRITATLPWSKWSCLLLRIGSCRMR